MPRQHLNAYEVVFARINGLKYPEKREEDANFEAYFTKPRCVEAGTLIAISGMRESTPSSVARINSDLDVKDFYYYISYVFVNDRTNFDVSTIVKASRTTCDMKVTGEVFQRVRFRDDDDLVKPAKKFQVWQLVHLDQSRKHELIHGKENKALSMPSALAGVSENSHGNDNANVNSSSAKNTYYNLTVRSENEMFNSQYLRQLLPLVEIEGEQREGIKYARNALQSLPVAVECISEHDAREYIKEVTAFLGMQLYLIDTKQIRDIYNSDLNKRQGKDDSNRVKNKVISEILGQLPCIVLIQGLDEYLDLLSLSGADDNQIHRVSMEFAFFASSLIQAINDKSNKDKAAGMIEASNRLVLFHVLTHSVENLNSHIKSMFPSSCAIGPTSVLEKAIQNMLGESVVLSQESLSMVIDLANKRGLGSTEVMAYVQETAFAAFQRENVHNMVEHHISLHLNPFDNFEELLDQAIDSFGIEEEAVSSKVRRNSERQLQEWWDESMRNSHPTRENGTLSRPRSPLSSSPSRDFNNNDNTNNNNSKNNNANRNSSGVLRITPTDIKSVNESLAILNTSTSIAHKRAEMKHKAGKLFESSIDPVRWEDIGGMINVRKEILDIFQMPVLFPQLFSQSAMRRKSILLYGPPGTGKTMVAKAVATECGMSFVSVKGPELLDAYVGESEKNVREIFHYARSNAPCVIFFDELDSLAPARGKGSSGGGVMDRVVSQILAEMDELSETSGDVYVIGATNRPDLLEPALLRPGRFDRKIYISLCVDVESKEAILSAASRNFALEDDVNLKEVAAALPTLMSGAGIAAICRAAYSTALERLISELGVQATREAAVAASESDGFVDDEISIVVDLDDEDTCTNISSYLETLADEDIVVHVSATDFLQAATNAKPSISESDLREYEALEKAFDDRAGDTGVDVDHYTNINTNKISVESNGAMEEEKRENGDERRNDDNSKLPPTKSLPLQKQVFKRSHPRSPNKMRDNHEQVYR